MYRKCIENSTVITYNSIIKHTRTSKKIVSHALGIKLELKKDRERQKRREKRRKEAGIEEI